MSTTAIVMVPGNSNLEPAPIREKWWERLTWRCASPDCPRRGKLWPIRIRAVSGVEFDGRWYCQIACLKQILMFRVSSLLSGFLLEKPRTYRIPLGLLLVQRGAITPQQLPDVLRLHRESGGRLGDCLLDSGFITEEQLTAALGQQWGCPVFPLERQQVRLTWSELVPVPLLESAHMVPAYVSPDGRMLHLAFCDRVDHTTLYGIDQMLQCRTVACVSSARAVGQLLDYLRRNAYRSETCFDTVRDPNEIVRTIESYAGELQASRIFLVRAGSYLWVRFRFGKSARDLLFRILPISALASDWPSQTRSKVISRPAEEGKDGASGVAELV